MKKTHKIPYILFLFFFVLSINSCQTRKKLVYFQARAEQDSVMKANLTFNPILEKSDLIAVDVTSIDLESVKPFVRELVTISNTQSPTYNNGIAVKDGYLIDSEGNINLPIIGKVKVDGLSRADATNLIQDKLKSYLNDPIVSIRILNFKVTVLGDVRIPGIYTIPNEKITVIEAVGLAGDLNITGLRKNVLLIREENGQKKQYRLDLTDVSIFESPVYYLKQNDVIYVEPNRAKRSTAIIGSSAGVFISVASLIITTVNLITK